MKKLVVVAALLLFAGSALAYHEFQEAKRAYKVETIQYFSNLGAKTEPDSTVTIYYDGEADTLWYADRKTHKWESSVKWRYWEIYRKVVKGCGNATANWIWNRYAIDSVLFKNDIDTVDCYAIPLMDKW